MRVIGMVNDNVQKVTTNDQSGSPWIMWIDSEVNVKHITWSTAKRSNKGASI